MSVNRSFPGSPVPPPVPLYQNEVKCSTFYMEIIFHSDANKSHFHKKGCTLGLILIVRIFGTRKWPVAGPVGKNVKFQVLFILVITERGTCLIVHGLKYLKSHEKQY